VPAIAACLALLIVSCAVIERPSGGPEDKSPPRVVKTIPGPDSAGIARDIAPIVLFSEKVNPASFKNRVFLYPPVEFEGLRVKGERLEISFKSPLPETTMCLLIRAGIEDYHQVKSRENHLLYFATEDSIARGEASGVILFKEKPDSAGVAELFSLRVDSLPNLRTTPRARVAFSGRDGKFSFRALPTDESMFLLRAFSDQDGDGRYSEGKEFFALWPDTIALTAFRSRIEEIRINIIDPNEPGSIEGTVVNETGTAGAATIRLAPAKPEARPIVSRADSLGAYLIGKVPPGSYLVSAFIDLGPDSICGTYHPAGDTTTALPEPCAELPDTLQVKPGERRKLDPIRLK